MKTLRATGNRSRNLTLGLFVGALMVAVNLGAITCAQAEPPSKCSGSDEVLQLQGRARRYYPVAPFAEVSIGDVELYTPEKLSYEKILSGRFACMIKYTYLRHISADYFRPYWRKTLSGLGASTAGTTAFVEALPETVNKGQTLELTWTRDSHLNICVDQRLKRTLSDKTVFRAAFNSILGPDAPRGVPEGLIGKRPTTRN